MNAYFKEELLRAFHSKSTITSLILTFCAILIGAIESILFPDPENNAFNVFLYGHSNGTSAVLAMLFPLLVSIPFVSSYIIDLESGYLKYVLTKMSLLKYAFTRIFVNGLVGGFVLSFSLLVSFLLFVLIKGTKSSTVYSQIIIFQDIFNTNPWFYIALVIINSFLCGFVFATFGLGLSALLKNKYLSVLSPFLFYIFSGTILYKMNPLFHAATTYVLNYGGSNYMNVLTYDFVLLLIGVITFGIGVKRNAEENF